MGLLRVMTTALSAGLVSIAASAFFPHRAVGAGDEPARPASLDQLKQQRKKAAQRKRRIIFNNDGNEPVYYCKKATPEALLDCRTTALVGTQVDSIFYCTWSSGFGMFTHNTKVGEVFTCKANPPGATNKTGFSTNKTADFIRQGTDPLRIMVDFCKKHGIEIFWSMRVNDTHDAWGGWYSEYLFPKLKREHPEWLVASKAKRSRHGGWSAVDFGRPEIRDLAFRYVEEVCQNYDVDGVELDFFRHPVFFKRHAMGQDCGPEECRMMTELVRRIRRMTEEVGLRRGRPILVAVRVLDSAEANRAIGLDMAGWLEEGLVDLMAVSGYFRLSPWETSVELGHEHGVPVYPCLSESRMRGQPGKLRQSLASYRARAMNVWAGGADGVYLFNSFNPKSPLWSELGDSGKLAVMEKLYTTGARGTRVINSWLPNGKRFLRRSVVSPEAPLVLKPGEPATIELRVGEDVAAQNARGFESTAILRLQVKGPEQPGELAVSVNGKPIQPPKAVKDTWLELTVPTAVLAKGTNRIGLALTAESKAKATVQDLLLQVRYRKTR